MHALRRALTGSFGLCAVAGVLCAADIAPSEQARQHAEAALQSARAADVARETTLRALENALALREDHGRKLLAALRDGRREVIRGARTALERVYEDSSEALEQAEEILEQVELASASSTAAALAAQHVADARTDRQARSAMKELEQAAAAGRKASASAVKAAESLKKQWLLPDVGGAAAKPATGQPQ